MPDKNKNGKLLCQCSIASIRHNNNCLPGTFCNFACVFLYNLTIKYTKKIRYLIPISLFFYCVANVENTISFACTNVVWGFFLTYIFTLKRWQHMFDCIIKIAYYKTSFDSKQKALRRMYD